MDDSKWLITGLAFGGMILIMGIIIFLYYKHLTSPGAGTKTTVISSINRKSEDEESGSSSSSSSGEEIVNLDSFPTHQPNYPPPEFNPEFNSELNSEFTLPPSAPELD